MFSSSSDTYSSKQDVVFSLYSHLKMLLKASIKIRKTFFWGEGSWTAPYLNLCSYHVTFSTIPEFAGLVSLRVGFNDQVKGFEFPQLEHMRRIWSGSFVADMKRHIVNRGPEGRVARVHDNRLGSLACAVVLFNNSLLRQHTNRK